MTARKRNKRRARNTASATRAPLKAPDRAEPPSRRFRRLLSLGAMLATAALLTLAMPPIDAWPLAYVAMLGFLAGVHLAPTRRSVLYISAAAGLAYWLVSLHWLSWVTPYGVGYFGAVAFLLLYWVMGAVILRAAMRRGWGMWIVLPIVWVALEFARAYVISGFPWFMLGHTQWRNTALIQVADTSGVYGVSFFVAMVNGLLWDAWVWWRARRAGSRRFPRRLAVGGALTLALLAGLLSYGTYRLNETPRVTQPGPVVGIVQEAFPIVLGRPTSRDEMIVAHFKATRDQLAPAIDSKVGCDIILWPETVLPHGMNREFLAMEVSKLSAEEIRAFIRQPDADEATVEAGRLRLSEMQEDLRRLAGAMARLVRRVGCPILAGGSSIHRNPAPIGADDLWVVRNSAVLFDGNDIPAEVVYSKMHLVPFSEYVPFKQTALPLHKLLRWFVPPVMEQLDYGRRPVHFPVKGRGPRRGQRWTLAAPICYEGTFGRVCRRMVRGADPANPADVLANLSNDGWFVRETSAGWTGSAEHPQHLSHYVFRAIETRTPVVRSVNTGISASVSTDGKVLAVVEGPDGEEAMVTGCLLLDGRDGRPGGAVTHGPQVLVDGRSTLYSVLGDAPAAAVVLAALVVVGMLIRRRKDGTRQRNET